MRGLCISVEKHISGPTIDYYFFSFNFNNSISIETSRLHSVTCVLNFTVSEAAEGVDFYYLFIENLESSILCCVWKEHVNSWASTPEENTAFLGSKVYCRYQGNHLNVRCWAFRENSNLVKSGCLGAA